MIAEGGRIDHDTGRSPGLMQPGNHFVLGVGLATDQLQAVTRTHTVTQRLDIGQGVGSVDLRFTFPEQIQIGTIEQEDR